MTEQPAVRAQARPTDDTPTAPSPRTPRWRRALAATLAWVTVAQPLAAQASQIAQEPLFVAQNVPPNVMLLLDDSQSMATYDLPPTTYWQYYTTFCSFFGTCGDWVNIGSTSIPGAINKEELRLRHAAFNPLAYNPTIRYEPWDDNGNAATFPNADIGGTGTTAIPGQLTQRDMRFLPGTRTPITGSVGRGTLGTSNFTRNVGGNTYYYQGIRGEVPGSGKDLFTKPDSESWQSCTGWTPPTYQGGYEDRPIRGPGSTTCVAYGADPSADPPRPAGCTNQPVPGPIIGYEQVWNAQLTQLTPWVCNGWQTNWTHYKPPARYYRVQAGGYPYYPWMQEEVVIDRAKSRDYSDPANRYRVIDPTTGVAGTRSDCAAGSWCTFEEEAQNYANWYTYYRTRLFSAIAVLSQSLAGLSAPKDNIRLGFGRINLFTGSPNPFNASTTIAGLPDIDGQANPGALVRGVRQFAAGSSERQAVFDWLFTLQAVGGTPNREALDAVGRYFSRSDQLGPWADYPGAGGGRPQSEHLACRRNFTLLATDGGWTNASFMHPRLEDVADTHPLNNGAATALTADGETGPTITGDGPNAALPPYRYEPLANPQFYGAGGAGGPSGAQVGTLSDVSMFYWNRDLRPDIPNAIVPSTSNPAFWQHMSNLVVGYGLVASMDYPSTRAQIAAGLPVPWPHVDLNPNLSPNASYDGNRVNDTFRAAMNSRGDFYTAANPQAMRDAIRAAFSVAGIERSSGTAVAAPGAVVSAGDRVFAASFETVTWNGELKGWDASALLTGFDGGSTAPPVWTARIPPFAGNYWSGPVPGAGRRDGKLWTSTAAVGAGAAFTLSTLPMAVQNEIGVSGYPWTEGTASSIWLYVYGDRTNEGWSTRPRLSLLGDIVNSSPVLLRAIDYGYQAAPAAGGGSTYKAAVSAWQANRKPVVLVGANAGVFHAFNADPSASVDDAGMELWGYVPRAVLGNLRYLPRKGYQHRYYVDGPTILGDASFDGSTWRTIAVGSTGAGGAGLFALDVTDPTTMNASKVLWDLTGADEPDLGSVLGTGTIGSTKDGKWVAIVPNGYESANHRAVLLVIDLQTGARHKLDTGIGSAASPNGLGAVTPVYDRNRNIVAVYAGDKQGNLWRFDLSSTSRGSWSSARVFTAKDASNQPQAITTAPRILPHPLGGQLVVFGTGKLFELNDRQNAQTQSIYALWQQQGSLTTTIAKSDLQSRAWTQTATTRTLGGTVDWSVKLGWYADLPSAGERVIANPALDSGAMTITSFVPDAMDDPCKGGGQSWQYIVDAASGEVRAVRSTAFVGGIVNLQKLDPEPPKENEMTRSALNAAMANRYDAQGRALPAQLVDRAACHRVGMAIDSTVASVPRACAPMLPLRSFREQVRP